MISFNIKKELGAFKLNVRAEFPGGLVGIWGKSGSGKTTLLKCLAGFLQPSQGEILFNKEIYFSSKQRINVPLDKREMGMVFQNAFLFPHLNVEKNIYYGLRKDHFDKKYIRTVIDLLNLYKYLKRDPISLSGGEQQKVALARTLIYKPQLLLMDEPISSLDWKTRQQIIVYLKEIHHTLKLPIIYVTHSFSELLFLVQQVYVLKKGKNIGFAPPEEILAQEKLNGYLHQDVIENIYDLPILKIFKKEELCLLDFFDHKIYVSCALRYTCPRLRIGIKANDIIISKSFVRDISARNIIPAIIQDIYLFDGKCLVLTKVNKENCWVGITKESLLNLNLKKQDKIFLIIKARSIEVLL